MLENLRLFAPNRLQQAYKFVLHVAPLPLEPAHFPRRILGEGIRNVVQSLGRPRVAIRLKLGFTAEHAGQVHTRSGDKAGSLNARRRDEPVGHLGILTPCQPLGFTS